MVTITWACFFRFDPAAYCEFYRLVENLVLLPTLFQKSVVSFVSLPVNICSVVVRFLCSVLTLRVKLFGFYVILNTFTLSRNSTVKWTDTNKGVTLTSVSVRLKLTERSYLSCVV